MNLYCDLMLKHILVFMSVVAVYVHTKMYENKKNRKNNKILTQTRVVKYWSCKTLILSLALRKLATSYLLAPMALVKEKTTAFSL